MPSFPDLTKLGSMSDEEFMQLYQSTRKGTSGFDVSPYLMKPAPPEPPGFVSSNLKKGYATAAGAVGGLAKFLGAEDVGQTAVDYWKNKSAQYEKERPTLTLDDIHGVGDTAAYIGQHALQMAPMAMATLPFAAGGGALGALGGLGARGVATSAGIGAGLGSIGTEAGIISGEVAPGEMDRTQILKGAIPAGLLEVVPELLGFARTGLGKKAVDALRAKYGSEIADQAVDAAVKGGFWTGAGKVGKDLGMIATAEGMTESAQSPLEAYGAGKQVFKEGKSFMDNPLLNTVGALTGGLFGGENYTPEMRREMVESLAAGAAGGVGMGGAGHALNKGIDLLTKRPEPQVAATAPVTSDNDTSDDLLNGTPVQEQIRTKSGDQMDLFGGADTPNAPVREPFTFGFETRRMDTGERGTVGIEPGDPYSQTLFKRGPIEQKVGLDVYTPTEPTAAPSRTIISPEADRKFEADMKTLVRTKVTPVENEPAKRQKAIVSMYKQYANDAKAIVPQKPSETLSVEAIRNMQERKLRGLYIKTRMENDSEFNVYPEIQQAVAKEAPVKEAEQPLVDKTASMGTTSNIPGLLEPVATEAPLAPAKADKPITIKPPTETQARKAAKARIAEAAGTPQEQATTVPEGVSEEALEAGEATTADMWASRNQKEEEAAKVAEAAEATPPAEVGVGVIGSDADLEAMLTKNAVSQTTKREQSTVETRKRIAEEVKRLTGDKAAVEFVEGKLQRNDGVELDGESVDNLISLVMDSPRIENIARHEVIHVLKNLGLFTKQEWNVLEAKAQGWLKKYNIQRDYPNLSKSEQLEEAIARAFEDKSDKSSLMKRITDFLESIWNYVKGRGFQSASKVLSTVESGEVGARPFNRKGAQDFFTKAAVARKDFLAQLEAARSGDIKDGSITTLDDEKGVKITHDSIRGNLEKFIKAFEPSPGSGTLTLAVQSLYNFGSLLPTNVTKRSDKKHSIPTAFSALRFYKEMLYSLEEQYADASNDAPLNAPIGNSYTMKGGDLNTVGELRRFIAAYDKALFKVETGFASEKFMTMIEGLNAIEDMGFSNYRIAKTADTAGEKFSFFDRGAFVKMYTFYHFGSTSPVLFPEWYVFANPKSRTDLKKMQDRFDKQTNLYFGIGDNINTLSSTSIRDAVKDSQLVKDMIATMSGKNTDQYLLRGYTPKDFNWLVNLILLDLQGVGVVRRSDSYGDPLPKTVKDKGDLKSSYSLLTADDIDADVFHTVPVEASFEELSRVLAESQVTEISEDADFATDLSESGDEDSGDITAVEEGVYNEEYAYTPNNLDDLDLPAAKPRVADTRGFFDPDMMAAAVGGQPRYSTHIAAHKDDFRIAGHPLAADILAYKNYDNALKLFEGWGKRNDFKAAVESYKDGGSREAFIKRIFEIAAEGIAYKLKVSPDDSVSDQTIKALQKAEEAKISQIKSYEGEDETRVNKALAKASKTTGQTYIENIQEREFTRPGAPLPYSFALNQMAEELYKEYAKLGGKQVSKEKEDSRANILQKLALIASLHVEKYKEWPYYIKRDRAIEAIMEHVLVDDKKSKLAALPIVQTDSGFSMLDQQQETKLTDLLMYHLGFTNPHVKQPVYAQIAKEVADERKKTSAVPYAIAKNVAIDKVKKLLNKINLGIDTYKSERALRTFLTRISNGMRTAKLDDSIDYVLINSWSKELRLEDQNEIIESLENIVGDIPAIDESRVTQAPSIDMGSLFKDYKNLSEEEKTTFTNEMLPHIEKIISKLVMIDVTTKVVTNKDGSSSLQIFPDSKGIQVDEALWKPIEESAKRLNTRIFDNPNLSMTDIAYITESFKNITKDTVKFKITQEQFDKMKQVVTDAGFEWPSQFNTLKDLKPKDSWIVDTFIKAFAGMGDAYTTQVGTDKDIPDIKKGLSPGITANKIQRKLLSILHPANPDNLAFLASEITSAEKQPEKVVTEAGPEAAFRTSYVVRPKIRKILADVIKRFTKDAPYTEQQREDIQEQIFNYIEVAIEDIGNPTAYTYINKKEDVDTSYRDMSKVLGLTEVDFNLFEDILSQFYEDAADFMHGRVNETTGRTEPVQHVYKNKANGELVYAELSDSGVIGNQEVRYHSLQGARKNVKIMSADKFRTQFTKVEIPENKLTTMLQSQEVEGKTMKTLGTYAYARIGQKFTTALRDIPPAIQDEIKHIFFESRAFLDRYFKSKDAVDDFYASGNTLTQSALAKLVNKGSFTVGQIMDAMFPHERLASMKQQDIKYAHPDVFRALTTALENLKEAGLLSESFSESSNRVNMEAEAKTTTYRDMKDGKRYKQADRGGATIKGGRRYLLTEDMLKLMEHEATLGYMKKKSSVAQSALSDTVDATGQLKATFRKLKQHLPDGTSESVVIQLIKYLKNIFVVPFFKAQRMREFMPILETASMKGSMRDFFKKALGVGSHESLNALKELKQTNPEEYNKFAELAEFADATQPDNLTYEIAKAESGVSRSTYDMFMELHKQIGETMPTAIAESGAVSYMAKFEGRFEDTSLRKLAYDAIGKFKGTLSKEQIATIAAEITPSYMDEYWSKQFKRHLVGYNDYLNSKMANIASVKWWMPRIREIGPYEVKLKDADGNTVGVKYFKDVRQAEEWARLGEAKDPSLFKYRKIEGAVKSSINNVTNATMGMFSTMDSAKEFDTIQKEFDGDLSMEFTNPWFGNATLEDEQAGSKHLVRRANKLIVGYNTDDPYTNYITAIERMSMSFARLEYGLTQFGHLARVKEMAKTNPKLLPHIREYTEHLRYDLQRMSSADKYMGQFKSITVLWFMAGRILPAIVNMLQTPTTAAPALAKEYEGGSFAARQARATKDLFHWMSVAASDIAGATKEQGGILAHDSTVIGKAIYNTLKKMGVDGSKGRLNIPDTHRKALEKFTRNAQHLGMFNDVNFGNELDDADYRRSASTPIQNFTEEAMKVFSIGEIINREGTFLASFDHYLKKGLSEDEAYTKAWELTNGTQYMVNKFNVPLSFKQLGVAGSAAYSLMSFPFQLLNQTLNLGMGAVKGDFDSAKVLLGMLAVFFMLGGAEGLPFKDLISFLYNMLISPTGDMDTDARRIMNGIGLNDDGQNMLMYGLPALAGITISGNIGMRTPIIGGLLDKKSPTESLFGASAAMATKPFAMMGAATRGDLWGMLENGPEMLAAPTRAVHEYVDVKRNKKGMPTMYKGQPITTTLPEAVTGALGFKTISKAERQETTGSERTIMDKAASWRERALHDAKVDGNMRTLQKYNAWIATSGLSKFLKPITPKMLKEQANKQKATFERMRETQTF